jgi:gamma-glutamyltranspeptidase/glutathione hydrolase
MAGAIAAGHPLSAQAGAEVLAAGGSATDAAVAAAFAAFVAEGPLTGPAGGGFFLHRSAGGEAVVLDCFFAVPSRRLGEMDEVLIDFEDASTQTFHVGEESVAVPGLLRGLEEAHRRWGRLPWVELVEPAVVLARGGLQPNEAQRFLHQILIPILQREEGGRRVYGEPDRVHTEELVPALERIRDEGAAALVALLPDLVADLASYRVEERQPLTISFHETDVVTTPAPSRGGAIVSDALAMLHADDRLESLPQAIADAYAGRGSSRKLTGTTHVSAIDAEGNAAALSMTLGAGSGVFRHGFQLNNMLGELDVIGAEAHPPGDRLPSMMTPTLVLADDRPRLVLGSAGSVRLAGAIVQVVRRVVAGEPVATAIEAPRLHPDGRKLHLEGGWPEDAAARLASAEWEVVRWAGRNLFFGGVSAVERRPDGDLHAAGDPRRGGAGLVVP